MNNTVIKVEDLGKLYRLGEVGTGTISHDINRWFARVRGKEDPFAKVGESNDRTQKGDSDYVWALKNVNFEVKRGEVLGIIGRNGAGKSTLLKLLSKTTAPSSGRISINGRIASLLEVGTGFHPEMTGRENIFLNGAILGMTKREIKAKFDEIVDFAGVERYVDTPVKRYSSGMYVRLAFAVAAHLEPDILIVDEVLAVGDAEFQTKCLGKMKDVSVNDGRTVLFVSHNMAAVKQLCTKGILMKNGTVFLDGEMDTIIESYLNSGSNDARYQAEDLVSLPVQVLNAEVCNGAGKPVSELEFSDDIVIRFTIKNNHWERGMRCNLALFDTMEQLIMVERIDLPEENTGYHMYTARIPGGMLVPNRLKVSLAIDIPGVKLITVMPEQLYFNLVDTGAETGKYGDKENGMVIPNIKWS